MLSDLVDSLDTRATRAVPAAAARSSPPLPDMARVLAMLPTARISEGAGATPDGDCSEGTRRDSKHTAARIRALHALAVELEMTHEQLATASELHKAATNLVAGLRAEAAKLDAMRAASELAAQCLLNRLKGADLSRRRYLYVMGGLSDDSTRLAECERFDGVRWEPVAKLNRVRSAAAAAVHRGMLYCLGGRENDQVHASVDAFDGRSWTAVTPMGHSRMACSAASFQGCL